tara:strand:+ start:10189 stop:11490 length:1302 start_codon:yes stop_codon:yes gene_type:complete
MTWENILKRPDIPMPDYDKHFEYDPEWLEETIKAWDKENPARVLHIEAPSTPDPRDRLEDTSIRFAASRSNKFVMDSFKFITDRRIDEQKGLYKVLENRGYKITNRDAEYIRKMYGEKINGVFIPDEAKMYFVSVGKERAKIQREKNPTKRSRQPDSRRSVADIEEWNRLHEKHNLDTLEGFVSYTSRILQTMLYESPAIYRGHKQVKEAIIDKFKKDNKVPSGFGWPNQFFDIPEYQLNSYVNSMLRKDLGREKHKLYLAQKSILSERWVSMNIIRPVYNLMLQNKIPDAMKVIETRKKRQEETDANISQYKAKQEKERREAKEADIQRRFDERNKPRPKRPKSQTTSGGGTRTTRQGRVKQKQPNPRKPKAINMQQSMKLGRLQRQYEQAKQNGQTGRAANLKAQIDDIKSKIGKMSWQDILKIYRLEEFI